MQDMIEKWINDPFIIQMFFLISGLSIIYILMIFLKRSATRYLKDQDMRYRSRKGITFLGYFLSILFVTIVFDARLGNLTVAFGVAGAGIAFALQEVIASIGGWVAVSFSSFYKTGDRVQLGGIRGDVIDIGILRTTLMEIGEWVKGDLYNGRIVRIANSFVFKEPVLNYSSDFPFLWDEIMIPVKYGSNVKLAREILEKAVHDVVSDYTAHAGGAWKEIVSKYRIENASVEPMVSLDANENWLAFTVRYVVDYKKRRWTKDRLFSRILEAFDQTGGQVQITSPTLQLVEPAKFDVQVVGAT